jgi:DNA-directed RNA polymerase specialized sigma24 family protein
MAPVMDAILNRLDVGFTYGKDEDGEWMSRVNHRDMEDALSDMSEKEREMIRKFFLERKSLLDISRELNMPMDLVGGYIMMMETRITIWM